MKIIKPKVELEFITPNALKFIEKIGRTCYCSFDKITEESAEIFCKMIKTRNHMSVLEHASATFRIICDRGVSHEIVRHRICSFSQESTRYCNYGPDKKGIQFILPSWAPEDILGEYEVLRNDNGVGVASINLRDDQQYIQKYWTKDSDNKLSPFDTPEAQLLMFLANVELYYNQLIKLGQTPQQARAVLPNCLKTEIVMTANFREWLHFLELRTSSAAHPDMRIIANQIGNILNSKYPMIFEQKFD